VYEQKQHPAPELFSEDRNLATLK